jgi:hypothetical protein
MSCHDEIAVGNKEFQRYIAVECLLNLGMGFFVVLVGVLHPPNEQYFVITISMC